MVLSIASTSNEYVLNAKSNTSFPSYNTTTVYFPALNSSIVHVAALSTSSFLVEFVLTMIVTFPVAYGMFTFTVGTFF